MIYPLKNWKTVERGYRFGEKTTYGPHHLGLDLKVPEGTPVLAPLDCDLIKSMVGEQGGNTIWIGFDDPEYGPLIMRFLHLQGLEKPLGEYQARDIIGYTGNTGSCSTGPHLHIDISRKKVKIKDFDNFIDPEIFFSSGMAESSGSEAVIRFYQKKGEEKIYALVGDRLVHLALDVEVYKKEFPGAVLEVLSASEFARMKRSDKLVISLK